MNTSLKKTKPILTSISEKSDHQLSYFGIIQKRNYPTFTMVSTFKYFAAV